MCFLDERQAWPTNSQSGGVKTRKDLATPEVIQGWNDEINKAPKNPERARKCTSQGMEIVGGPPGSARVFIDRQIATWARVVRDNGIKAD